jgi:hypothetical protein
MLIEDEPLITLDKARHHPLLRNEHTGRPCNLSKIYRLVLNGARARTGTRIKLPVIKTTGGLRTSDPRIRQFIRALNDPAGNAASAIAAARRVDEISAADRTLTADGFELAQG